MRIKNIRAEDYVKTATNTGEEKSWRCGTAHTDKPWCDRDGLSMLIRLVLLLASDLFLIGFGGVQEMERFRLRMEEAETSSGTKKQLQTLVDSVLWVYFIFDFRIGLPHRMLTLVVLGVEICSGRKRFLLALVWRVCRGKRRKKRGKGVKTSGEEEEARESFPASTPGRKSDIFIQSLG